MSAVVTPDIIGGSSAKSGENGIEATRVFWVDGMDGAQEARITDVLSLDGIPKYRDSHPSVPACFVQNVTVTTRGIGQFAVTVVYGSLSSQGGGGGGGQTQYEELGASTSEVETDFDSTGKLMNVSYTPDNGVTNVNKNVKASIQVPMVHLRITKYTKDKPDPVELGLAVGAINSPGWHGGAAKTWLMTRCDAVSNDGGQNWLYTYEFAYRFETWDATLAYFGADGVIPTDAVLENGIEVFQVYQFYDFARLGIS